MTPLEILIERINDDYKKSYIRAIDVELFEFVKEFIDDGTITVADDDRGELIKTIEELNNSSGYWYLIECDWGEPVRDKASVYFRNKAIDEILDDLKNNPGE